jgi:hypothetical protein
VTKDLTAQLQGIGLDDEKSVATYERGFLNLVVPLIGSREAIDAARKWAEPEEMQERIANRAIAKRQREEEVAAQQQQGQQEAKTQKNKKKKKKKMANQKAEPGPQLSTNKRTASENDMTDRIAAEAGAASEKKVDAAVKKNEAKEAWLQSKEADANKKRRKRNGVIDEVRETVKQRVAEQFSTEGKKKVVQQKKLKKKQRSEAPANVKEKKSVKFA